MNDEFPLPLPSISELGDLPKRRRTPSQYAAQIDDFKNNLTPKRPKSFKMCTPGPNEQEELPPKDPNTLSCLLPNGRPYSLKVLLSQPRPKNAQKPTRQPLKKTESTSATKPQVKKEEEGESSLLDKFLSVFIHMQKQKKIQAKVQFEGKFLRNKEEKRQEWEQDQDKEKEEKWWKSHEKFKTFSRELDALEEKYIFLN